MARDLEQYAQDAISGALNDKKDTAENLASEVDDLESDFDLDSFAPYTSEEDDILSDYESDCAYSSIFEQAKSDLKEALEEFADDARDIGADDPVIEVSMSCVHGWAPHDRELADGTMIWEPGQLEGCRAISREVSGLWLTCTWTPTEEKESE
jgi:hypothetical protein